VASDAERVERTEAMTRRGDLHRFSLRFVDAELERMFQLEEGAKGKPGFKITALAAAILWAVGAILIPVATPVPAAVALMSAGAMSAASLACFWFGRSADTLDRQHFAIAWLTVGNGLVIIAIAVAAGSFRGYAVGAIMLLYVFGFVTGTRFVFALMRTALIAVGFTVAVLIHDAEGGLALDVFLFVAASIGSVLALRRFESERRRIFHQRLVISEQSSELQGEKEETERLLLNILPASISMRLRRGESPIADSYPSVSVLFADLQGFTPYAARLTAAEVTRLLSELFLRFDDLVAERGLEKIKTIGDAYMAAGGLPEPLEDHAIKVVDLGLTMIEDSKDLLRESGLALRVGVNSGPVSGGVIGSRRFAYDIWGNTVNFAARLQMMGLTGRVHVSEATRSLIDGRYLCEVRDPIDVPGIGVVSTFLINGANPGPG
jgi:class 3 adenylate cyclase